MSDWTYCLTSPPLPLNPCGIPNPTSNYFWSSLWKYYYSTHWFIFVFNIYLSLYLWTTSICLWVFTGATNAQRVNWKEQSSNTFTVFQNVFQTLPLVPSLQNKQNTVQGTGYILEPLPFSRSTDFPPPNTQHFKVVSTVLIHHHILPSAPMSHRFNNKPSHHAVPQLCFPYIQKECVSCFIYL